MQRDETTLLDIVRAGRLVLSFIDGLSLQAFQADLKTQSAVLHQLLIIGEAVKRLSVAFRDENPDITWKLIAGMRDHLIHAYDTVDLDEVWSTATNDIPALLDVLEPMVPSKPQ